MSGIRNRAALVHLASLGLSFVFILICARRQWFFFDEWAFLVDSGESNYLAPHVGHWSTAPMLITHGLKALFGLNTYWPYLIVAVLVHLGIAHLLWRILLRVGTDRWVAVALAFFFAVLGAGAQNILWGFQVGFMGAVLAGLGAALIADIAHPTRPVAAYLGFAALSTLSLMFAGTALPVLVASGIIAWRRRGPLRAALLLAPAVVIYAIWYLYANLAFTSEPAGRVDSLEQLVVGVPGYAAKMFVDALQLITPVPGFGIILFTLVFLAAAMRLSSLWATRPLAIALLGGAIAFAFLTGFSRINLGLTETASGRYVYLMIALMVPLLGVMATWAIRRGWVHPALAVGLILCLAVYNAGLLRIDANDQGVREQNSRDIISAAAAVLADPSFDIPDDAQPEPVYAPDLTAGDLRALVTDGELVPGPFSEASYLTAVENLTTEQAPPASG